jgi:crotonobetainyl-CoA:carnitine CoA-transferase CaiB-like acyl-CoA transferase
MHARSANRVELIDGLSARLKEATALEWEQRFQPLGIPAGVAVRLEDVLDGEFLRTRDLVVSLETEAGPLHVLGSPIRFDGVRGQYAPPPRLHEHTDSLLGPKSECESISESALE